MDKSAVFGKFAGYFLAEHDLAIYEFVQRLTMLQGKQRGSDAILAKAAPSNVLHVLSYKNREGRVVLPVKRCISFFD